MSRKCVAYTFDIYDTKVRAEKALNQAWDHRFMSKQSQRQREGRPIPYLRTKRLSNGKWVVMECPGKKSALRGLGRARKRKSLCGCSRKKR